MKLKNSLLSKVLWYSRERGGGGPLLVRLLGEIARRFGGGRTFGSTRLRSER